MKASCLMAVLAAGLATSGVLAETSIPLEVYARLPTPSSMALSPDGDRVAFRRMDATMDAIFVQDRFTGEIIGTVDGSETRVRNVSFLDQDRLVLYASEYENFRRLGRQLEVTGSFILDLRTRQLSRLLENSRHLYPLQTGTGRIVGHDPESDTLYMPAFIGELEGPPASYGLLEVTMDDLGGHLLTRGTSDAVDWFVDADGRILAEEEYDPKSEVSRIWGRKDGERVLIYESGPTEPTYKVVGLSRDMHSLVVSARLPGSEYSSYFQMNVENGSVGPPLFQREDASVERPLIDTRRRVYGVEYSGFFPSYEFFDPALTARVRAIQAGLKSTAAYLVDWSADFRFLLFRITGGWTSGAYMIVGPDSPTPQLLANVREEIPREAVAPTKVIQYQARDGLVIPALVTARAEVRAAGKAPLIVLPHGGPESYDRYGFDWLVQYFASRGIVVLQPQVRGSTGFGINLRRAGKGEWGRAMSEDLDDGVKRLIEDGLADPARVCMVGARYGGYAALAAGAFSPFNYKCLVSIAGLSDLPRMLESERNTYGRDSNVVHYWRDQLGVEDKSRDTLDPVSPVNFAENFRAPVLLVHGRDDTVVPIDQSLRMEKALERADKPVKLVRLKGEDHHLSAHENRPGAVKLVRPKGEDHHLSGYETRLEALRAVAAFIEENL